MGGENLEIEVQFDTGQAIENGQRLAESFEQQSQAAIKAAESLELTEQAAKGAAGAYELAAKDTRTAGEEAHRASQRLQELAEQYRSTGNAAADAGEKGTKGHKDAADAAKKHKSVIGELTGSISGMIQSYLGLQGVLAVWNAIDQKMKDILAAQGKLVGEDWQRKTGLQDILRNMPTLLAQGEAGEQQASRLVQRFQKDTATNWDQAIGSIASANATGIDLSGKEGDPKFEANLQRAERVGKFAARAGLDKDTIEQLYKFLSDMGVNDAKGTDAVLAKLEAAFINTGTTNLSDFTRGALAGVAPSVFKAGGGREMTEAERYRALDQTLGIYSTYVTGARSTRAGSQQTRELFELAESNEQKTKAYLAHEAAKRGLSKIDAVTPEDVEQEIATDGDSEEALGVKRGRTRLAELGKDEARAEQEEKTKRERYELAVKKEQANRRDRNRAERLKEMEDAENDRQNRVKAEAEKRQQERANLQDEIGRHTRHLAAKLQSQREVQAFGSVPDLARIDMIRDLAAQAGRDPDANRRFHEGIGGSPEGLSTAVMFGTDAYQQRRREAEKAAAAADPAQNDVRFQKALETTPLQNQQVETENATRNAEATGKDLEFAERFTQDTKNEADRGLANSTVFGSTVFGGELTITRSAYNAAIGARRLINMLAAFWASLTPEERRAHPEVTQLIRDVQAWDNGNRKALPGAVAEASLREYAKRFGAIQAAIVKERREAGTDASGLDYPHLMPRDSVNGLGEVADPVSFPENLNPDVDNPQLFRQATGRDLPAPRPSQRTVPLPPGTHSTGVIAPGPTTGPATRPTTGPVTIINFSPGNMFVGGVGDLADLPGRLEGLG